ncbi:glycosyltransferase family 4 protein [Opitutus terrae]|uniref:Glycosyl transferase group 1 n=1 Tax=Opitutus terrae (strain DSM 11246 / JCM 15787 / PB90-1) TaxID=452637 RepID=B1ZW20_OPITP|nr:glycosyltransferase family 4 protein [Opitutus terrae]ACB76034.1 glycosyl transferase group 1 [Opitutus terrae PB90-1]
MSRLAIVISHPTQYYSPWFRWLAGAGWTLRVFYLWDFGVTRQHDPGFQAQLQWDLDLLSGYEHEFVPNTARHPGTARFFGLRNPSLSARLRAWRPDAVLVYGYGWWSQARLALTWRGSPLILRGDSTLLGRETPPPHRRRPQQWLTRLLLKRYQAFASVGIAHTRFLVAHGVARERIFLVPHCVDNDRWAAGAASAKEAGLAFRASLGIPASDRVVLFAGKFGAKKRPDLLIEAFQTAALAQTSLLMIGDGPLRTDLQARNRNANVFWAPFQNQLEMPHAFAAADLLVLPSHGPGETWGLIVNEAMASGLPCLVSTHVGCREDLISEDVTGWSFPAGDSAALAARLQHALSALETRRNELRAAIAQRIANYSYAAAAAGLRAAVAAAN